MEHRVISLKKDILRSFVRKNCANSCFPGMTDKTSPRRKEGTLDVKKKELIRKRSIVQKRFQ
jgi:hypothetical protein